MDPTPSLSIEERLKQAIARKVLRASSAAIQTAVEIMTSREDDELSWQIARDLLRSAEALNEPSPPPTAAPGAAGPPAVTAPATLIQLFSSAAGLSRTIDPERESPLESVIRKVGGTAKELDEEDDVDVRARHVVEELASNENENEEGRG